MSKRVLLTGANGFLGSHILSQLLAAGHSVRAVVRSTAKETQIYSDFPSFPKSQLETFIVPDMTMPGAFASAVVSNSPFSIIIHTASPFLYKAVSDNKQFLEPALNGTLEMLKAAKGQKDVERVVITSSCAAVIDFSKGFTTGKIYSEEDWNPVTWDGALSGTMSMAYQASKKYAEKAGRFSPPPTSTKRLLMDNSMGICGEGETRF